MLNKNCQNSSEPIRQKKIDSDIKLFYSHCHSEDCVCPKGRNFTNSKWIIDICLYCQLYGFHKLCRPNDERMKEVFCNVCKNTINTSKTVEMRMMQLVSYVAAENEQGENILSNSICSCDDHFLVSLEDEGSRKQAQRSEKNEMRQFRLHLLFREL